MKVQPTRLALVLSLALLCGCEALKSQVATLPVAYSLDVAAAAGAGGTRQPAASPSAPTLIVSPPHAAAGFDSQRIMYIRQPGQLEYFAQSEWVDTPARMLASQIVTAVEGSGAFRAVVQTPSPASGEMRLDTEILRLQHEFLEKPSRVRFTLRAYVLDTTSRRVIATREFDAVVPSASEDARGGVEAAVRAVRTVLGELSAFCAETARSPLVTRKTQ